MMVTGKYQAATETSCGELCRINDKVLLDKCFTSSRTAASKINSTRNARSIKSVVWYCMFQNNHICPLCWTLSALGETNMADSFWKIKETTPFSSQFGNNITKQNICKVLSTVVPKMNNNHR